MKKLGEDLVDLREPLSYLIDQFFLIKTIDDAGTNKAKVFLQLKLLHRL